VISGTTKISLTETNAVQTASAVVIATDADNANTFVARNGLDGDHGYGTFSIDTSGQWTYTMNTAHDEFVAGQVYTDNATVSTIDGTSLTLKVEITGTNDAAVITSNEVVLFETDAALTATGKLDIYDFDNSAQFVAGSFKGSYGTLTLTSTGAWNYQASSAHNEFIVNGLYSDAFTVTAADGTTSTVKVNIIGTAESNNDLYSGTAAVNVPTTFTDNSLVHLSTAGVQQVNGGFDDVGLLVNAREDVVKLDFNLANADFKTSADGHHVEVTFNHDASTMKLLSNVEAVQFNDALVRIIGADGYKDVAEATNAANKSHFNSGEAVFVSVARGYDALLTHPSTVDLNNTYNTLTDSYNHHG
jgi:VCBS repeat-containing protein